MKKYILIALAIVAISTAKAQQHIPDTVTIKLSRNEVTALFSRIDSVQNIARTSDRITSGWFGDFERRLQMTLNPIYLQIQSQIADEKKKVKKL